MSYEKERQLIETHFKTQWDLSSKASLVVKYENIPFLQPHEEGFVALFLASGEASQITLGLNPLIRNIGIIFVQIFTPIGKGSKENREIIDVLNTIFSRETLVENNVDIVIQDPLIIDVGENDGWYQTTVSYPFRRDDVG